LDSAPRTRAHAPGDERDIVRGPDPSYFLAFDHRSVLRAICADALGCRSEAVGRGRLLEAKALVVDALLTCPVVDGAGVGLLIDENLGADQARRAHDAGLVLAMPVEVSGARSFELEFGDEMVRRLQAFEVDYAKALVYLNPELEDLYRSQIGAVVKALGSIAGAGLGTMLEVVVTPTAAQLALHDGDAGRFDRETRPGLVCRTIHDFYAAGAQPTLWKLEGFDSREDYGRVQAALFAHDRDARCLVLGRGLSLARVREWLRLAAGQDAFCGFAVGRTIWQAPVAGFLAGELDGDAARAEISGRFTELVNDFREVRLSTTRGHAPHVTSDTESDGIRDLRSDGTPGKPG
jgi:myo-inositol catabolism protein IolC